jgi:alternate signal-mediated exported protein
MTHNTLYIIRRTRRSPKVVWLAGAAVAALLLGGGSFALWGDQLLTTGGNVTAGDLDISYDGDGEPAFTWWDVSTDRADGDPIDALQPFETYLAAAEAGTTGHPIDNLDTWRMVPGDTIVGLLTAHLALEGDNLVAALDYACDDLDRDQYTNALTSGDIADLVTISADLYQMFGDTPTPMDMEALAATTHLGYFEAPVIGQAAGLADAGDWTGGLVTALPPLGGLSSRGEGDVALLVTVTFSADATDQELARQMLGAIHSGALRFTQVRGYDTPGQFVTSSDDGDSSGDGEGDG